MGDIAYKTWVNPSKGLLVAASLSMLAACGSATEPGPGPGGNTNTNNNVSATGPTYHQDVRPLLADKCGGCHLQGGLAPFNFETYENTAPLASLIAAAVRTGRMPPWGAQETAACDIQRPFQDDLRLEAADITLIESWAAAGAPEGTAPQTLEPFAGKLSNLPRVDKELVPSLGFSAVGNRDQFRCFVLDPQFMVQSYLQGLDFDPGNEKVVHHAIVYADPSGTAGSNLADADGQYDCFGGPGFSDTFLVAAWAPGAVPLVYPDNAAMPLPAGSKLVLQIHYHPLGDTPEQDLTKVRIMYTEDPPEYLAAAAFVGNFPDEFAPGQGLLPGPSDTAGPEFVIPAGASDHLEKMALTIPFRTDAGPFTGAYIYSVATHMHYVGTDMSVRIRRAAGAPPCNAAESEPLSTCVQANCPNATGFALSQCAEQSCGPALNALSPLCGSCLQEELISGTANPVAACGVPFVPPADLYGTVPEQSANECLIQTPAWDFNWQRSYVYDAEIQDLPFIGPGDTFELDCHYNNSMSNPFVREALAQQGLDAPREVVLGDETLDEMCLLAVSFLYKAP